MSDTSQAVGQMGTTSATSEFNGIEFMVGQMLGRLATATVVKVVAVKPGATNALTNMVGTVDVLPLVNQIDGAGNVTKHKTVFGLSYSRIQGGANAVIMDPVVGDLGIAVFANRDISSVKASKAQANPGSKRRFSYSDGMYVGGLLNGAPTQYVIFSADGTTGITLVSPGLVKIQAPNAEFTGNVKVDGLITATGNITAGSGTGDSVGLQKHTHPTAPDGPPSSPTAGT